MAEELAEESIDGYRLHQGIPGSELPIIPGAEHGLMTNEAGRMRALILQFL